jgi:hypothetical protein
MGLNEITYPTRRVEAPQQPNNSMACGYFTAFNFGCLIKLAMTGTDKLLYSRYQKQGLDQQLY